MHGVASVGGTMCSHLGETDDSTSTRGVVFNLTCVKMTLSVSKVRIRPGCNACRGVMQVLHQASAQL